jgi:hypothetical protein
MSVSRGNGQNGGHFYSNITQPVKLDLNFVVDVANGNGLGLRSLKSNGYVRNVFMHSTSSFVGSTHTNLIVDGIASGTATLAVGMPVQGSGIPAGAKIASITSSSAITLTLAATTSVAGGTITFQAVGSPNPAAGYALIQFKNNYNVYLGGFSGFVSPVSGTPLAATTAGLAYVIVSLGTTTLAQWQAAGVPAGLTPAVGMSFIALQTGALGGTGAVEVPSVSGITSVEVVGNPNVSNNNSSIAANGGAWLLVQFLGATAAGNTALIATAPAPGSVVGMSVFFDASSVTIDGL